MPITDLEPHRTYIDAFDLTEEEKLELVNAISMIAEVVLDRKYRNILKIKDLSYYDAI